MNLPIDIVRMANRIIPIPKLRMSLAKRASGGFEGDSIAQASVMGGGKMRLDLNRPADRLAYVFASQLGQARVMRSVLRPGDRCIDAGANTGILTLYASSRVGENGSVIAFEPHPTTCRELVANVAINRLENVVRVVHKGVSDQVGAAELHEFLGLTPESCSLSVLPGSKVTRSHQITLTRMDDEAAAPIKLIKMDVEGSEWKALRGAVNILNQAGEPPHLLIELNPDAAKNFGYHPLEMIDWLLERFEYQMTVIRSTRFIPMSRDELRDLLMQKPHHNRDIWLSPRSRGTGA